MSSKSLRYMERCKTCQCPPQLWNCHQTNNNSGFVNNSPQSPSRHFSFSLCVCIFIGEYLYLYCDYKTFSCLQICVGQLASPNFYTKQRDFSSMGWSVNRTHWPGFVAKSLQFINLHKYQIHPNTLIPKANEQMLNKYQTPGSQQWDSLGITLKVKDPKL